MIPVKRSPNPSSRRTSSRLRLIEAASTPLRMTVSCLEGMAGRISAATASDTVTTASACAHSADMRPALRSLLPERAAALKRKDRDTMARLHLPRGKPNDEVLHSAHLQAAYHVDNTERLHRAPSVLSSAGPVFPLAMRAFV